MNQSSSSLKPRPESHLPVVNYDLRNDEMWKHIPAWKQVSRNEFSDYTWQIQNSVSSIKGLTDVLQDRLTERLLVDLQEGLKKAPMNVRMTPYLLSLIDWEHAELDPIRRQFLPLGSQLLEDHPRYKEDSLHEDEDKATPYLTHRYVDKALFLPTTICPVYCSYCTRSRVVGGSTSLRDKPTYGARKNEWTETFDYIRDHQELEDIVISGGDSAMLRPEQITFIGNTLLNIPHVRRIRFATKGIAILPMQFTSNEAWIQALAKVSDLGRSLYKEVCVHTHFGSEFEISDWTMQAMQRCMDLGIRVRNQSVLLRGVNDSFESMFRLIKKLSYINVQPYYVYAHDMVPGCEHLRTTIGTAKELSKNIQGATAGFNVPRIVCDAPGGGGKREISSHDFYDPILGISAWTAPRVKPDHVFYYYDPIELLPDEGRAFWNRVRKSPDLLTDVQSEFKSQIPSLQEHH